MYINHPDTLQICIIRMSKFRCTTTRQVGQHVNPYFSRHQYRHTRRIRRRELGDGNNINLRPSTPKYNIKRIYFCWRLLSPWQMRYSKSVWLDFMNPPERLQAAMNDLRSKPCKKSPCYPVTSMCKTFGAPGALAVVVKPGGVHFIIGNSDPRTCGT